MNFVMSQIYMEFSKSIQSMKKHYFYSHQKPTKLVYEICLIHIKRICPLPVMKFVMNQMGEGNVEVS